MKWLNIILLSLVTGLIANAQQIDSVHIYVDNFNKSYVIPPTIDEFESFDELLFISLKDRSVCNQIKSAFETNDLEVCGYLPKNMQFDGRVLIVLYGLQEETFFVNPNGQFCCDGRAEVFCKNQDILKSLELIFIDINSLGNW